MKQCETCLDKKYPNADFEKMTAITVSYGNCDTCNGINVLIIPERDYMYASGLTDVWD